MRKDDGLDWIRLSRCLVCRKTPCDPHHVKTRGAGGKDENNVVPLCRQHHTWGPGAVHSLGIKVWQERFDIDLKKAALRIWEEHQANHPREGT